MSLGRTLRTLWHLSAQQLVARLRHQLWLLRRRARAWPPADPALRLSHVRLAPPPPEEMPPLREVAERLRRGVVEYLGVQGSAADFEALHRSRLWRYQRHYHSELVALAARALEEPEGPWAAAARELVEAFSAAAPPERGDAWEPYPTARRILSWSEAAALDQRLAPVVAHRLAVQLRHLGGHLEHHLRGNHLLCDAAALVAGGSLLEGADGSAALEAGGPLLERELARQLLPDGGFAERTVQYHAQVLRDAMLALQLAGNRRGAPAIKPLLSRMAAWLTRVRRPDGSYPWVNDAAPSAGALADEALARAVRLGLLAPDAPAEAQVDLPDTGWTFLRGAACELFFDRGPIGPPEQPGHGHSDAMAYELFWYGVPVVTDSGATTYQQGPIRDFERSAAAHATISVDGEGVDELWAAFRVGGRGRVERLSSLAVDPRVRGLRGKARSWRGWTHERALLFWPGCALLVCDRVSGTGPGAEIRSHVPLDPAWSAADSGKTLFLLGPGGRGLQLHVLRGTIEGVARGQEAPRDGWVGQGFGRTVARSAVRLRADGEGLACYAFFAPGVSARETPLGLALRTAGAEIALRLQAGMPA